jgi:hypothetical protein
MCFEKEKEWKKEEAAAAAFSIASDPRLFLFQVKNSRALYLLLVLRGC